MTMPRVLAMLALAALVPMACSLQTGGLASGSGFAFTTGPGGSGATAATSSTGGSTTSSPVTTSTASSSGTTSFSSSTTSTSSSTTSTSSSTTSTSSSTGTGGGATSSSSSTSSGTTCKTMCEALPAGWSLVYANQVAAGATANTCGDGTTSTIYDVGPAGAPTCAACTCGMPQGSVCGAPQITCSYSTTNCMGSDAVVQAPDTTCVALPNVPSNDSPGSCSITAPATLTTAGSCSASGGELMASPMWSGGVSVCNVAPAADGCTGGDVCLPAGTSPDGSLCITKAGTDACPAGWTTQTIAAFASGTDGRSCSACSCDVTCTGGGYTVFDFNGCSPNTGTDFMVTSACVSADGVFDGNSGSLGPVLATPASSCSGGTAMGQVTGSGPQQVCCR